MLTLIGLGIGWIVCGVFSAAVASSKGRSALAWFIVGCAFGPLALLAAVGMGEAKPAKEPWREIACRACRKPIDVGAIICPYCRTDLPVRRSEVEEAEAIRDTRRITILLVGGIVSLFVVAMCWSK